MPLETSLTSLEIERATIAGLLVHPKKIADLPLEIGPDDYTFPIHRLIFSIIKSLIQNNEFIDKVIISEKVKLFNIALPENIDIHEYIDSLSLLQINEDSILPQFVELKKYSICRSIDKTSLTIREALRANLGLKTPEIIHKVDEIYNSNINSFETQEQGAVEIFEQIPQFIFELGENPKEETGIPSPFSLYNDFYGGLNPGNAYGYCARPSVGKSTWLSHVCNEISRVDSNIRVLFLDTELTFKENMIRMTSAISGVSPWYIATGKFKQNKEMAEKVYAAIAFVKQNRNKNFYHMFVGNMPVENVLSTIDRWFYTVCGRNENEIKPVICYDYIKHTGEKLSDSNKEYQLLGSKLSLIRDKCVRIKAPFLYGVQLSRLGVTSNKPGAENYESEDSIAGSDRLLWYTNQLFILRRKTYEELDQENSNFGSHVLVPIKLREQGKNGAGHHDWVKIPSAKGEKPKYKPNYINYELKNFNIIEKSCLRDIVQSQKFVPEPVAAEDSQIF